MIKEVVYNTRDGIFNEESHNHTDIIYNVDNIMYQPIVRDSKPTLVDIKNNHNVLM